MNWKSSAAAKCFLAAAILVDKVQKRWYNRPALSGASISKARKKTTRGSGLGGIVRCLVCPPLGSSLTQMVHTLYLTAAIYISGLETAWASFVPPIRSLFQAATHTHGTLSRQLRLSE